MSGDAPERLNEALQRQRALSRWENEGGAVSSSSPAEVRIDSGQARVRLVKLKADMKIAVATRNQGGEAQLVAEAQGTYMPTRRRDFQRQ
jgi:hypothetical protein